MGDMDLEHYDEEEDGISNDEMLQEGALAPPPSDDAETCFNKHKGLFV